jgi:hypothetical protein
MSDLHACSGPQLLYVDSILAWAKVENERKSSFVYDLLNLTQLAAVGHSRGAKLAALHLTDARHPWVCYTLVYLSSLRTCLASAHRVLFLQRARSRNKSLLTKLLLK